MNKIRVILPICLASSQVFAQKIPFKPPFEPKQGWVICLLAILVLVAIYFVCTKRNQGSLRTLSPCLIIDKKRLNSKTMLYIIEYQNQQFLLADNQQGLALQHLKEL